VCSNVDLSSRFFEFLPELDQRPRDRQSRALTKYIVSDLLLYRCKTIAIWLHSVFSPMHQKASVEAASMERRSYAKT